MSMPYPEEILYEILRLQDRITNVAKKYSTMIENIKDKTLVYRQEFID